MEKMRMESINLTEKNIEKIEALFPNVITEGLDDNGKLKKAINFALLKQLLSEDVIDGDEAYEFTWVGKKASMIEAFKPIRKTLRPCKKESKEWDKTENIYIEGDNLEAIKILKESYLQAIDLIYIDPPYNSGNDFVYRDDFTISTDEYEEAIDVFDDNMNRLIPNPKNSGRFHSAWCSMIYPRLELSKYLLSNEGVIFISIDDNEIDNLKKICDEVFGISNFVAQFTIASNSAKNNSKFVSITHEYLLCYAKNKMELLPDWQVNKSNVNEFNKKASQLLKSGLNDDEIHSELLALVKYPKYYEFDHYTYVDGKGPFRASDLTAPGSKNYYDIYHPVTGKPCKTGTRGWAFSPDSMEELIRNNYVYFGKDESVMPQLKNYIFENEKSLPKSVLFFDSQASTKWMKSQEFGFDFPKSIDFIQYVLSMYPKKEYTVLDFFAGSSTTAHAVMKLNKQDNGKRKFILIQYPESCPIESEAYKSGYRTICDIGKSRIEAAGKELTESQLLPNHEVDTGIRVFKIDTTNMKDVYYSADEYSQGMLSGLESNIKEDRTDLDLLFGCLLEWGLPLSLPHVSEEIDGVQVHTINDGDLIACFAQNISEAVVKEIAKRKPLRAVFRDNSFANSPEKINVEEIFKLMAPNTSVKVL